MYAALVIHDPPYGLGIAEWDANAPTMEATAGLIGRIALLNQYRPWVYVSYMTLDMRPNTKQALLKHSFKDIQDLAWYKTSHQSHHDTGMTFTNALEYLIVGYSTGMASVPFHGDRNPAKRHNLLVGPTAHRQKKLRTSESSRLRSRLGSRVCCPPCCVPLSPR